MSATGNAGSLVVLITNAAKPYCWDVARLLGIPGGSSYRFRYRLKWVSQKCDLDRLANSPTVIVVRNPGDASLTAIRWGSIRSVLRLGDIVHIDFVVGAYIEPNEGTAIRVQLDEYLENNKVANLPMRELPELVLRVTRPAGKAIAQGAEREALLWDKYITILGGIDCFRNYAFFKFLGITSLDGTPVLIEKSGGRNAAPISLRPRTLYVLDVIQKTPSDIDVTENITKAFTLHLSSAEASLAICRGVQKIVGKYDVLRFEFLTPSVVSRKRLRLDFETRGGQHDDSLAPFLSVDISIAPLLRSRVAALSRILSGISAVVVMLYSTRLGALIGWDPDSVRAAAILLLALVSNNWNTLFDKALDPVKDLDLSTRR